MYETSHIEISKSAIKQNLEFIKSIVNQKTRISSVIKGNAYGHGIESYVPIAEKYGINHFSVFSADEAYRAKKVMKKKSTIMIMGMIADGQLSWAIKEGIEFFVFDEQRLDRAIVEAKKLGIKAKVHIEMETGLNRTGFCSKDREYIAKALKEEKKHIEFTGLCTHFAGAESIGNYIRIKKQFTSFKRHYKWFSDRNLIPKYRHVACSAATVMMPETQLDLVRIGVMQFGFWSSPEVRVHFLRKRKYSFNPLKRAMSWKTKVMNIKEVKAEEFIGYGTSYFANHDMRIAVIPVGYSHGYSRSLSNQGMALIRGVRIPVVGVVNMSAFMVDITNHPEIKIEDEVVLIGEQKDQKITVSSFSELSNQLNYQLLARLSMDIPRKIVK